MNFTNILSDEDIHKLKELSIRLKKEQDGLVLYKNHLSNLWRINTLCYKNTEKHIAEIGLLITDLKKILGES